MECHPPGAHLRVRRNLAYSHHGIYIGDNRVVEFGGEWWKKSAAQVREVSLEEFARSLPVEVVKHDSPPRLAGWMPTALPASECVERAQFLERTAKPGRYNLIGHNCEHAATWCATGFPESHQVRVGLYVNLVLGASACIGSALYVRRGHRIPVWVLALTVVGLIVNTQYHWHARRFVREIDREWRRRGSDTIETS